MRNHEAVNSKKRLSLLPGVGVVLLLSIFMISFTSCHKQEKAAASKEKITLGVAQVLLSSPIIIIAQEKGYFSEEGLDVTYKFYPYGKKALEAMLAGEVDIATVAETPIVFSSFTRDDFTVFATFASSYNDCKVLGRKDRGINTPADLQGKKLGITTKTSGDFFAYSYLIDHHIDPASVTMVDLPAQDLSGALQDGRVDAIAVFEPHGYKAIKALADRIIRLPPTNLYRETFNLVVMKNFAETYPERLNKVLRAVDRAEVFIKQNRKDAIAMLGRRLNMDENMLSVVMDDFVFELSLDQSLLITFEDEARWAITKGFTDRTTVPNYLGYIYLDGMKEVKPKASTIAK